MSHPTRANLSSPIEEHRYWRCHARTLSLSQNSFNFVQLQYAKSECRWSYIQSYIVERRKKKTNKDQNAVKQIGNNFRLALRTKSQNRNGKSQKEIPVNLSPELYVVTHLAREAVLSPAIMGLYRRPADAKPVRPARVQHIGQLLAVFHSWSSDAAGVFFFSNGVFLLQVFFALLDAGGIALAALVAL